MAASTSIHNAQSLLTNLGLDAFLVSSTSSITYFTSYAGFSPIERDAYLLITSKKAYLFTSPLYHDEVKNSVKDIDIVQHTRDKPFFKNLAEIISKEKLVNIGFENESITVAEYLKLTAQTTSHFVAASLDSVRGTKSDTEIQKIQKACDIGTKAMKQIKYKIKPGISEREVATLLELAIKKLGGELSFPSIIAFGSNSAIPHHHTNDTKLKSNDIVLMDFGVKYESYCSDMTRTFFVGNVSKDQTKAYDTVLHAQQKAVEFLQSKLLQKSLENSSRDSSNNTVLASDVDKIAREYITSQKYPPIPHSLGHGIGIQVHEAPSLSPNSQDILTDCMVFSIEPGIYISGKFGIRIEDLYAIQKGKLIQLT